MPLFFCNYLCPAGVCKISVPPSKSLGRVKAAQAEVKKLPAFLLKLKKSAIRFKGFVINSKIMGDKGLVSRYFEEISENYFIPPEIEPILKNALDVRTDVESSFDELEKERLPYTRIKKSMDSHIAGIVMRCKKK
jgi:hypothetical protein